MPIITTLPFVHFLILVRDVAFPTFVTRRCLLNVFFNKILLMYAQTTKPRTGTLHKYAVRQ